MGKKISARALADDIRSGGTTAEIAAKHEIQPDRLVSMIEKLIEMGALTADEAGRVTGGGKCPACGHTSAHEFVECPQCGVFVAKFLKRRQDNAKAEAESRSREAERQKAAAEAQAKRQAEQVSAQGMEPCRHCKEMIRPGASKCPHCGDDPRIGPWMKPIVTVLKVFGVIVVIGTLLSFCAMAPRMH